jgi:membrane fusion protein (multidrug efflux system)
MTANHPASPAPRSRARGSIRRPALILLGLLVLVGAIAVGLWWFTVGRHFEDTDDAYVGGRVVTITSQVPGTVVSIGADENETVVPGQALVRLDATDARNDLARARAQLAQAVREAHALAASGDALQATAAQRQGELARAQDDLQRRRSVKESGAVSQEDIRHAELAVTTSEAALLSAREQLRANRALTAGTPANAQPAVLAAAARLRETFLTLRRGEIPAPITGQVARRTVQVGQRIAPGTALMTLIPMSDLWVDANFKEVQIARMHPGQPALLVADVYGNAVKFHGRVASFAAGTGAAFALLPAQNATGNWIKVVQRVPVRIRLDPAELAAHPLRVGLSMRATVDITGDGGNAAEVKGEGQPSNGTKVYDGLEKEADSLVRGVLAANAADPLALTSVPSPAERERGDRASPLGKPAAR